MIMSNELGNFVNQLHTASLSIPRTWDGRKSITEMRDAKSRQWRQMEWMGFYFEFLCERKFAGLLTMPGKSYGPTKFDGFNSICWDFKAHTRNATKDEVITNDTSAVKATIEDHGHYGLVLAVGSVEYDDDAQTFKQWHDELKGRPSAYVQKNRARGVKSRRRKTGFVLEKIHFICLDTDALSKCEKSFQKGMRNSNGKPRPPKVLIDVAKVPNSAIVMTAEFAPGVSARKPV